jgi:hypothetical protein
LGRNPQFDQPELMTALVEATSHIRFAGAGGEHVAPQRVADRARERIQRGVRLEREEWGGVARRGLALRLPRAALRNRRFRRGSPPPCAYELRQRTPDFVQLATTTSARLAMDA